MTKKLEIYKCEICGNMVELVHEGKGELVCCGKAMVLQKDNVVEASFEKHIPVIEKQDEGILVKVGDDPHPMMEQHFIEWIEVIAEGKACRQFLKPDDKPEAFFKLTADNITVRAYCNLHGMWIVN